MAEANGATRQMHEGAKYRASDLLSWEEQELKKDKISLKLGGKDERRWEEAPFRVITDLNAKVMLWSGPVEEFECVGIVCPNLENLKSKADITKRIFKKAGKELFQELEMEGGDMRTSEVRVTKAYKLPCRYVIHCVEPKYTVKFETAAETALFSCYHRVLIEAHGRNLRIIAIPSLHSKDRGYPVERGTHVALRTVRRYLERFPDAFEKIVFNTKVEDEVVYNDLMSLYFPRTSEEEELACYKLPAYLGNEKGEMIHEGREIRVMRDPLQLTASDQVTKEDIEWYVKETGGREMGEKEEKDKINEEATKMNRNFATMNDDLDEVRQQTLFEPPSKNEAEENRKRYLIYLRNGKTESLASIAQYDPIFKLGFSSGRMVLGFASKSVLGAQMDINKAKLYFVKYMDSLVNQPYILVYFHTLSEEDNYFSQEFFESLYNLSEEKYKRNLHAMFILHPYFWFKMQAYKFLYFIAYEIRDRVWMLSSLKELCQHLGTSNLEIPQYVLDYDYMKNGPFRKESSSSNSKGRRQATERDAL